MSDEEEKDDKAELKAETLSKIEAIIRHIENVKDNCLILGKALIEEGEIELGKQLIANSYLHDNSKFYSIEWDNLSEDAARTKLDVAVSQHNRSPHNKHHPESWGEEGIDAMPRLYLAEMVCDWKARSEEFGESIRKWVDEIAMARFGYKKNCRVHKEILYFVNMLCDKPFKQRTKPSN